LKELFTVKSTGTFAAKAMIEIVLFQPVSETQGENPDGNAQVDAEFDGAIISVGHRPP
jgi:hypothetical protein